METVGSNHVLGTPAVAQGQSLTISASLKGLCSSAAAFLGDRAWLLCCCFALCSFHRALQLLQGSLVPGDKLWRFSWGVAWSSSCLCCFAQGRSHGRFAWSESMIAAALLRDGAVAACSKLLLSQLLQGRAAANANHVSGEATSSEIAILSAKKICKHRSRSASRSMAVALRQRSVSVSGKRQRH